MINLQSLLTVISTLIVTRNGRRFPLTLLIIALKRGQTLQRLQLSNILFTADRLRSYNLGQNRWKICTPLPPQIKDGKMASFCFCTASSLIWGGWGFAVPFYFVQDCTQNISNRLRRRTFQ